MRPGRVKRVHVNQHVIRANQRSGERVAPLRVKTSRENIPATAIELEGPARVIYSPDRPLSCGARVWIETNAPVVVTDDHGERRKID